MSTHDGEETWSMTLKNIYTNWRTQETKSLEIGTNQRKKQGKD
jgi:hypothetical protein